MDISQLNEHFSLPGVLSFQDGLRLLYPQLDSLAVAFLDTVLACQQGTERIGGVFEGVPNRRMAFTQLGQFVVWL